MSTAPTDLAIVGAGGVLGSKLLQQALSTTDARIHAFVRRLPAPPLVEAPAGRISWRELDIARAADVSSSLAEARPQVVINAAAMTNVDACEVRRDEAWATNALGVRHVAETCARIGATLLHVSTDYVFPGDDQHPGPYLEDAPVRPVNHYGWTKLMGERAVQEVCADRVPWMVARTALVYGYVPGGRINFVSWLAGELRGGRTVRIVDDQFNTPTLADDLASALLHLMHQQRRGIFHLAGSDLLSRSAWAYAIARGYDLDAGLIQITTSAELRQTAHRPLRSGLRSSRNAELAGIELRGVVSGLAALEAV